MNKREFLQQLDKSLYFMEKSERDEIINDYEEHFRNELLGGNNEYQIASDLGDPGDIALQFMEERNPNKKLKITPINTYEELLKPKEPIKDEEIKNVKYVMPSFSRMTNSNIPLTRSEIKAKKMQIKAETEAFKRDSKPRRPLTIGSIISTLLVDFLLLFLGVFVFGLYIACWCLGGSLAFIGVIGVFYVSSIFTGWYIVLGAFILSIGIALIGLSICFSLIKGVGSIFISIKKFVMFNFRLLDRRN